MRRLTATVGVLMGIAVTLASLATLGGWVTAVGAPLTLGITWLGSRSYLLAQLRRERARAPVSGAEIALLVGSFAVVLAAAVAVVALVAVTISLVQLAIAKVIPYF